MKPTTLFALAAPFFASSVSATCLSQNDASTLANNFGKLVSAYSQKLANQTFTAGFIDYSESVNTLMDNGGTAPKALLGETFASRADFESASSQTPAVPFTVKNLWYTCDTITFRWESDQSPQPVVGISVAHTVFAPLAGNSVPHQIDEIWGEFDSAAWLVNLGVFKPASKKERREVAFQA